MDFFKLVKKCPFKDVRSLSRFLQKSTQKNKICEFMQESYAEKQPLINKKIILI